MHNLWRIPRQLRRWQETISQDLIVYALIAGFVALAAVSASPGGCKHHQCHFQPGWLRDDGRIQPKVKSRKFQEITSVNSDPEKRRKPRRKPFVTQRDVKIQVDPTSGASTEVSAKLLDISEDGIGVQVKLPLFVGSWVKVTGEIDTALGRKELLRRGRVCWCRARENGSYEAGLSFEAPSGDGA